MDIFSILPFGLASSTDPPLVAKGSKSGQSGNTYFLQYTPNHRQTFIPSFPSISLPNSQHHKHYLTSGRIRCVDWTGREHLNLSKHCKSTKLPWHHNIELCLYVFLSFWLDITLIKCVKGEVSKVVFCLPNCKRLSNHWATPKTWRAMEVTQ